MYVCVCLCAYTMHAYGSWGRKTIHNYIWHLRWRRSYWTREELSWNLNYSVTTSVFWSTADNFDPTVSRCARAVRRELFFLHEKNTVWALAGFWNFLHVKTVHPPHNQSRHAAVQAFPAIPTIKTPASIANLRPYHTATNSDLVQFYSFYHRLFLTPLRASPPASMFCVSSLSLWAFPPIRPRDFSSFFPIPHHRIHSSGAVWESRWTSWAVRPNEPSGFRGRKDLLNRASALVTTCP